MFLFENTLLAALLGFLLITIVVARRLVSRNPAPNKSIAAFIIIIASLVFANWAIITPREQICATCHELARLVDNGDVAEIGKRLAPEFAVNGIDRDELLGRLSKVLTNTRLDQVRLWRLHVELESNERAVATFSATCNIRTLEGFSAALPSRWRLLFNWHENQWQISSIESIPIQPLYLVGLERVLNLAR